MFRHTPVTLYICGRPKIGKSHLLINIVKSINEKLYHFKDYNKIVYARTVTTEHWDGYIQQPIIIFDDHYKMHDGEQKTDASEVMNVVSCTNYYPSFAFLHNKGTPVNSDILLITSNVGWPSTIFLPTALQRRHKHHLIVVHNDKPMNNNFDHLDFYYCEGIIDPWNGNYSAPYTFTREDRKSVV